MNLTEKVAFIKGLTEGLKLNAEKDEVKVLNAIVDLLEDMALTVNDLEERADEASDLLEVMDEDLAEIEEYVYGDNECTCGECDEDEEIYEVTCPSCGETICVTEEILDDGTIKCPNCDEDLEFDFSGLLDLEEE